MGKYNEDYDLFGEINLGLDEETSLNKKAIIWQIVIDGKSRIITVVYDIVLLSPRETVVKTVLTDVYTRFNSSEVLDKDGNVIKAVNMKWDALRNSPIGQGILQLIATDVSNYNNSMNDLKQN